MAPSRLAPNATFDSSTLRKRSAKTRLAMKMGVNQTTTASRKRGSMSRPSRKSTGTTQATAIAASSATYSSAGRAGRQRRATSIAASTETSTPAKTSALTNQVVPNSSANWTTLLVSSSRNAAPMKNRST